MRSVELILARLPAKKNVCELLKQRILTLQNISQQGCVNITETRLIITEKRQLFNVSLLFLFINQPYP